MMYGLRIIFLSFSIHAFSIHVYTFAETLLLFFLLESFFFNIRLCIHEFSLAKVIKMHLMFSVFSFIKCFGMVSAIFLIDLKK